MLVGDFFQQQYDWMYRVVVTNWAKTGKTRAEAKTKNSEERKTSTPPSDAPTRNDVRLTSLQRRAEWTRPQRTAPFATVRVKEEKGCRADARWKRPSSTWYQAAIRIHKGLGSF